MSPTRPDPLRLRIRATVTVGSLLAVIVVLLLLGVTPSVERLAGLAVLGLLVAVLVWEVVPDGGPDWDLARHEPVRPAGQDAATASWVRLIEAHRALARPDDVLQSRLRVTVEDLVRVRRGVSLTALDDDARRSLLGDDLERLLFGPPARTTPAALLTHLERIERL